MLSSRDESSAARLGFVYRFFGNPPGQEAKTHLSCTNGLLRSNRIRWHRLFEEWFAVACDVTLDCIDSWKSPTRTKNLSQES